MRLIAYAKCVSRMRPMCKMLRTVEWPAKGKRRNKGGGKPAECSVAETKGRNCWGKKGKGSMLVLMLGPIRKWQ